MEVDPQWEESDDSDVDTVTEEDIRADAYLENLIERESTICETVSAHSGSVRSVCTYANKADEELANIQSALKLNKLLDDKYKQLEIILSTRLRECRKKFQDNVNEIVSLTDKHEGFAYVSCGKPYFKDKNNFPPPENEDTILMKNSDMYDFSTVSAVPGWTVKDKTELVNALLDMSREIRKKELKSKIAKLRREQRPGYEKEITLVDAEIAQLKNKTLPEIVLPLNEEYDWETLSNKLNRRHSAQEYQSLWKLFFHPSINKGNWSKTEHRELQKIACTYNMQDWDQIAKQLNTGRTGYQCFVYFRTNMSDSATGKRWSNDETEYLSRVVECFREDNYIPWGKVATAMDNRTKIQCYNKYLRIVEKRKGRFLPEEDAVILSCFDKYGFNFKRISKYLPGRSSTQLRTRYSILSKMRLSTTWTIEMDRKLVQIMANMDSSANFSHAVQHFPGKDRLHIRSRYITLMKWMKKHPTADIALAPRRGARRLVHGYADMNLSEAVERLKNRMQTEVQIKRSTKITENSNEKEIDDAIAALIVNEIIKEEAERHNQIEQKEAGLLLPDNTLASSVTLNVTNLRKLLLLLNVSFDKEKFKGSKYSQMYKGLEHEETEVSHVKVKSYSKKQSVTTIKLDNSPDIWGNKKLGITRFVIPPHFATLTGCRVLMNHLSARNEGTPFNDEINLSLMSRRNMVLKNALNQLKERFTTLFLWPMLLSNDLPQLSEREYTHVAQPKKLVAHLPSVPCITIPPANKKFLMQLESGESIDCTQNDEPDMINILTNFDSGTSSFG